jgi:predicted MFS family arabinose efflux permease
MDDPRVGAVISDQQRGITPAITIVCAIACGAMVANLYYAQPLIALIAPELHIGANIAGLIVKLTMLGYAGGLLLVVALADRLENRRLILATVGLTALALVVLAVSPSAATFLAASVAVGFASAGVQVVLPFAASLAPHETRGATIGNVMSGLLAGIMLSRPAASLIAEIVGARCSAYRPG